MHFKQTKTGDLVQVRECNENDVTYGLISISLKATYTNLSDAESALLGFMKQLQQTFAIYCTTGLCIETFVQRSKTAITDYWQDAAQRDWKVKGWTNGKTIAFLYIKNIGAVSVDKEDYFLNGSFIAGM